MTEVVIFGELACRNGKRVGIATLNSERSLNALSSEMIELLLPKLAQWRQDNEIAIVILQGAGEKAFCAGGDVVHLYKEMKAAGAGNCSPEIEAYFTKEYSLDYLIHTFNKPILCWGNGIIMGGGLGILAGASHRVVTESARIAMPEITIGLFPDVGATYFLNKMPNGLGLFLGLTGASVNAADAMLTKLADYIIEQSLKSTIIDDILSINWEKDIALNHEKLSILLAEKQLSPDAIPKSKLKQHDVSIQQALSKATLADIVDSIINVESDDKWFIKAQRSLSDGSSISAHLVYKQLNDGKDLNIASCFRKELSMAVKCGQHGEFEEGVRALLIDKDNQPKWQYAQVSDVPVKTINWFFEPIWLNDNHPLGALGK